MNAKSAGALEIPVRSATVIPLFFSNSISRTGVSATFGGMKSRAGCCCDPSSTTMIKSVRLILTLVRDTTRSSPAS